jgi:hypothetical protein
MDKEGKLEQVYLDMEASPAVSGSLYDASESTVQDFEIASESDSDASPRIQDDAPNAVELDGDVNIARNCDDEEDEQEEDEEE